MKRRVWVLNHFAVPLGQPGGTRHTELFGHLDDWDSLIFAARVNPSTRQKQPNQHGFCFVPVSPYRKNGLSRVFNWVSFAVNVVVAALWRSRKRPNIIYASSPHLLTGVAGAALSAIFRVPFVLEVRDLWPKVLSDMGQIREKSTTYRLLAWLESMLYVRADRIVALTNGTAMVLRNTGVSESKITTIPNGADPGFFKTNISRSAAREEYGFSKLTFLYAGAHGPANGLEQLLQAASEHPNVDVVFVGDGISRLDLIDRASHLGLANVSFMPAVAKSEMPKLLLAADVGVHCLADVPLFRYGVSPNKLYDYMAAGKPVVTNTPGEMADLVEVSGSGVAVSPASLAEGMTIMSEATENQRNEWGRQGMLYMARHQSRQMLATRLLALLNELYPVRESIRE